MEFMLFCGFFCFPIFLPIWVFVDSSNRGDENAIVWTLIALFAPVIGTIIYILYRKQPHHKDKVHTATEVFKQEKKKETSPVKSRNGPIERY